MSNLKEWLKYVAAIATAVAAVLGGLLALQPPKSAIPATPPSSSSPAPLPPPTPSIPGRVADALKAIGKCQFGNAGCSLTIMGPRLHDKRWLAACAHHCIKGQPTKGVMITRDGKRIAIEVISVDPVADVAWMITTESHEDLPFATLASELPKVGEKVWHAGFGVDNPGNREDGMVVNPEDSRGQTEFNLSVSSGDSGGGIALNANGEIVATVCCKNIAPGSRQMWGASVNSIRKAMPKVQTADFDWTPIDVPARMP